jgi:hypothetical protein
MDEELNFERFLTKRANLLQRPEWQGAVPDWFRDSTLPTFSSQIRDKLPQTIGRSIELSKLMNANGAIYYLRLGAARRLLMMWHAYSNVLHVASLDRKEPLTSEESRQLTQDLNVIYVNIRGTLDNLCWALLHEHAPDKLTLPPSEVGLFKSCLKDKSFNSLATLIQTHRSWSQEVQSRRDPAAHRIPLTVPPQFVTAPEAAVYEGLYRDYVQTASDLNLDEAEATGQRMSAVGRFDPCFMHDPKEGLIPIYPTVPDDIGHVIDLFRAVDAFLVRASSSAV